MFLHIVLFRPKGSVSDSDRAAMFHALRAVSTEIASVRRFYIGNRVKHGRPYEQMMSQDYPFAAVVEFDDLAGLLSYLNHPKHERLGALFYEFLEAALVYDYEAGALMT
jgi:hypothetical protein